MQTDCGCQIARAVVDAVEGILNRKRYLIHDSRPSVHSVIQSILAGVDVTSVKLPPQCPSLNAYAERFVRSIKESSLDCLIVFGENSLRTAIREFVIHSKGTPSPRPGQPANSAGAIRGKTRAELYSVVNGWVEC